MIFDDSFEHEAWNDDSKTTRIVLILDVWHPDLKKKEIKFLDYLQQAALRAEKKMVKARDDRARCADVGSDEEERRGAEVAAAIAVGDGEALESRIYDNFFTVIEAAKGVDVRDEKIFP